MEEWLTLIVKAVLTGLLAAVLLIWLAGCAAAPKVINPEENCRAYAQDRPFKLMFEQLPDSYQVLCARQPAEKRSA